eukprot:g21318.t1
MDTSSNNLPSPRAQNGRGGRLLPRGRLMAEEELTDVTSLRQRMDPELHVREEGRLRVPNKQQLKAVHQENWAKTWEINMSLDKTAHSVPTDW